MKILTQGPCKKMDKQDTVHTFRAVIIQLKMCFRVWGCTLRLVGNPDGVELSKKAPVSSVEDALCSTGDILVAALCRQAWARSHGVAFCCLRFSNAAATVVFFPTQYCRTAMADSASESDTDGAGSSSATPMSSSASNSGKPSIVISQFRLEELTNRLASLQQENKVLKIELETFKLKCKALQEENRDLRKASVTIVSNVR